jgi:E3 ubiquitin-protein ligase TRIP12
VKGPVIRKSPAGSSVQQEDTNGDVPEISAREKLLNEQSELLRQFGMDLLPVLIQVDIYCIDHMNMFYFINLSN